MTSQPPKLTHVLEVIRRKRFPDAPDIKITEMATGKTDVLFNPASLDDRIVHPAWFESLDFELIRAFDRVLHEVVGGKNALLGMYFGGTRHMIRRRDKERLCALHAAAFTGETIVFFDRNAYQFRFVKSEITSGYDVRITKMRTGSGAVLRDVPDDECGPGFRKNVAGIMGLSPCDPPTGNLPVTKDIIQQIRAAYKGWTSRFLEKPHDPDMENYLKPQGFSPRSPS